MRAVHLETFKVGIAGMKWGLAACALPYHSELQVDHIGEVSDQIVEHLFVLLS